ncbi:MAG: hypothetical protein Q9192_008237 [Flavoplaca navasiana]
MADPLAVDHSGKTALYHIVVKGSGGYWKDPMCRAMLVWIVLLASLSTVLARVADVYSDTLGDVAVTVSTDFLPELTASEPLPSIAEAALESTTSALSSSTKVSTSSSEVAPTMSIQPCGGRGMRPCPQGQQCTYGKVAKLGFVQDLPGQCGAVDGLL